ncbi:hypothetical protein EV127DRAFT_134162 [Xylaria flabelliformis]|nr:hypothetical protein EV127DRAFT_134162 [Xylaria flabelliformis]
MKGPFRLSLVFVELVEAVRSRSACYLRIIRPLNTKTPKLKRVLHDAYRVPGQAGTDQLLDMLIMVLLLLRRKIIGLLTPGWYLVFCRT